MIIAHYGNRLPSDYDLGFIHRLTRERAPIWDARPNLYFKAFLLREAGRFGGIANHFSSLYLWRDDGAYRDWLVSGGYEIVTHPFGRAGIETRFALDARKGAAPEARFVTTEERDIPLDADLTAAFAAEIERNRAIAGQPGTVAAVVGVDTPNWRFTRIRILADEPGVDGNTLAYPVLHLARPLLDTLPTAGDR